MAPSLAPYAMDLRRSRGRRFPESAHPYRNDYARDRDRIIHSRAFRRLEAKTQVFTFRFSDHFRNRLTHTLEVTQIARTVAAALRLDSDLAEALALVHDIGHPPFGHAGEHALDDRMRKYGERFDHNLHALRIVESFEQRYPAFPGLNLTFEVREGIVKHSRDYRGAPDSSALAEYRLDELPPLEAQIIDLVDEIAYNTADLDDGFEAHLLDLDRLRAEVPVFDRAYADVEKKYPDAPRQLKFNEALKEAFDHFATDLIENTQRQVAASGSQTMEDIRHAKNRLAGLSPETKQESAAWKRFLLANLYSHPLIEEELKRSVAALNELFTFFIQHPHRMPASHASAVERQPVHRVVCDYIAGMTDHYLLLQCRQLLGMNIEREL